MATSKAKKSTPVTPLTRRVRLGDALRVKTSVHPQAGEVGIVSVLSAADPDRVGLMFDGSREVFMADVADVEEA